ncbi:hypothetical protein [Aquimarina brevivitae]|uniref:PsbP protein n=1 Tax=Aquimarina brevivitae TaxID=323412 RepID=A0A4Q7PI18_9FLAO|nr:hypothetical protein [Aquimarina brevivitae]RZT00234.1 hypothetical protein EV197_1470 [Aquimarina brevivitae]
MKKTLNSFFAIILLSFIVQHNLFAQSSKEDIAYSEIEKEGYTFKLLDSWFTYEHMNLFTYYAPKNKRGRRSKVHFQIFRVDAPPNTVSIEDIISHSIGTKYNEEELKRNKIVIHTTDSKYGKAYIVQRTAKIGTDVYNILTQYHKVNGIVYFLEYEAIPKFYNKHLKEVQYMFGSITF